MIKVVVAEDMDILRESLKYMIESDPELEVVGLAANGRHAFELCQAHQPDIVLMDLRMPGCDGLEGTRLIKSAFPETKILILTTFDDEKSIAGAIHSGADGYITKDVLPLQLQQSIKSVILGLGVVQKSIMNSLAQNHNPNPAPDPPVAATGLTDKEITLIRMVVAGKTYKEMAREICLSEGYVRNMVSDILVKLKLKDRVQLAVYAVKQKII